MSEAGACTGRRRYGAGDSEGAGSGTISVACDDQRLVRFVARSLADLAGLRMSTRWAPEDAVLAAGVPWYLTVFGRDSIWSARLLLPLGVELARRDPALFRRPPRSCRRSAHLRGAGQDVPRGATGAGQLRDVPR